MRSGNGRHRRPRQAPALVVAAGVAGSAIAIPLLGASGATAAEATTWDKVADCESGGMWSADHDNGFYGGLQLSQETWSNHGGTEYAPRADLASRSQQIKVAEKVLASQGPGAWPSCAIITGLTDGDNAAPADASTAVPSPGETWAPDVPEGSEGSAESDAADAEDAKTRSDKSEEPDQGDAADGPTDSAPAGTPADSSEAPAEESAEESEESAPQGKHRGEEAREGSGDATPESGEKRESGRHASRGDGATREAGGEGAREGVGGEYTVRAGDNLWAIADANDVRGGWAALYEANETAVGSDPDLIIPGQSLDLG